LRVQDYQSAFLYTGILQGLLIIAAAQFLGGTGQAAALSASAKSPSLRNQTANLNSGEMLKTYQFYWLYAMMLMMGVGGLLATAQVSQVAKTLGVAGGALAVSLTLNPIANGIGRVFWGWVSDRVGREGAMQISFFIQALALISVTTLGAQSSVMFVIAMAMVFFTWGPIYVLFPSTSADFFGSKNASSNYSFLYSTKGVAALIGGGSAAAVFEATGSWGPAFFGSAMLAALACMMAIRLKKIPLPVKNGAPVGTMSTTER
jgi:OFA family oxalate/formate antiporter-like MFS transporter